MTRREVERETAFETPRCVSGKSGRGMRWDDCLGWESRGWMYGWMSGWMSGWDACTRQAAMTIVGGGMDGWKLR